MIRLLITLCILSSSVASFAQNAKKQINEDVWRPFIYTYSNFLADSFMTIHTDDVVRVLRDGDRIQVGKTYAEAVRDNFQRGIDNEARQLIEFTFEQRIHSKDSGFEVGYYRVTYAAGGQESVFYGKFQVLLKKIDGKWKIAVDSDTSKDGAVTEEDFISGQPMK